MVRIQYIYEYILIFFCINSQNCVRKLWYIYCSLCNENYNTTDWIFSKMKKSKEEYSDTY